MNLTLNACNVIFNFWPRKCFFGLHNFCFSLDRGVVYIREIFKSTYHQFWNLPKKKSDVMPKIQSMSSVLSDNDNVQKVGTEEECIHAITRSGRLHSVVEGGEGISQVHSDSPLQEVSDESWSNILRPVDYVSSFT